MNILQALYLILSGFIFWVFGSLAYAMYYKVNGLSALLELGYAVAVIFAMLGGVIGGAYLLLLGYQKLADKKETSEEREKLGL